LPGVNRFLFTIPVWKFETGFGRRLYRIQVVDVNRLLLMGSDTRRRRRVGAWGYWRRSRVETLGCLMDSITRKRIHSDRKMGTGGR